MKAMGLFGRSEEARSDVVRCQKCGHEQRVKKGVLSVYCKRCMQRISTSYNRDGATPAIAPIASVSDHHPRRNKITIECPSCSAPNEVVEGAMSVFCKKCKGIINLKPSGPAIKNLDAGSNSGKTRTVTCYTCSNLQSVSTSALSTFCSSCGNRIDLNDWEIKTDYHEKIMTRGKLHVLEAGRVHAEVNVMDAKVDGQIYGDVHAENKLVIGHKGKIFGDITAREMELENGAFYSGNLRLNADKLSK